MAGMGGDGYGFTAKVPFEWNFDRGAETREEVQYTGGHSRFRWSLILKLNFIQHVE